MAKSLKIEDLIEYSNSGARGEIVKTQTTYLEIVYLFASEFSLLRKYRVHYRGKREFSIAKGEFTTLLLLDNHPLLLEYTEQFVPVQLISAVSDKQLLRRQLEGEINQVFGGWRSVKEYNFMSLDKFLEEGYGILMEAPKTFAEAVMRAAERSGVKLALNERYKLGEYYKQKGNSPRGLFFDERCVIADDFRVEHLD